MRNNPLLERIWLITINPTNKTDCDSANSAAQKEKIVENHSIYYEFSKPRRLSTHIKKATRWNGFYHRIRCAFLNTTSSSLQVVQFELLKGEEIFFSPLRSASCFIITSSPIDKHILLRFEAR